MPSLDLELLSLLHSLVSLLCCCVALFDIEVGPDFDDIRSVHQLVPTFLAGYIILEIYSPHQFSPPTCQTSNITVECPVAAV